MIRPPTVRCHVTNIDEEMTANMNPSSSGARKLALLVMTSGAEPSGEKVGPGLGDVSRDAKVRRLWLRDLAEQVCRCDCPVPLARRF